MKKILTVLLLATFICGNILALNAAPATDSLDIVVHKVGEKAPVIDGKVTAEEWGEAVMSQAPGVGYTFFSGDEPELLAAGMKALIYMLWDEEGFYVAAVAEDKNHFNQYSGMDIWNGDSFEFDSNFNKDEYSDRNRQTFGLNNDGEVHGGSYLAAEGVDWSGTEIQHQAYTATREGDKTTYEFFVPWENFCPDGKDFAKIGNVFRGNVQFLLATDGDYLGTQKYVLYDEATETSTYPNFILSDVVKVEKESEPEPEINDEQQTPANPQTSDNNAIAFISALLSICGIAFVILSKKEA